MLTSFFVRFTADISPKEFEELVKVAKRVESIEREFAFGSGEVNIIVGRHWVAITEKRRERFMVKSYILLPCSETDERCVESVDNDSKWLDEFVDSRCEDITLERVRYSSESNEADLEFTCYETEYRTLFNIVIDPSNIEQHDTIILRIIARYFGAMSLPAMFRPM